MPQGLQQVGVMTQIQHKQKLEQNQSLHLEKQKSGVYNPVDQKQARKENAMNYNGMSITYIAHKLDEDQLTSHTTSTDHSQVKFNYNDYKFSLYIIINKQTNIYNEIKSRFDDKWNIGHSEQKCSPNEPHLEWAATQTLQKQGNLDYNLWAFA